MLSAFLIDECWDRVHPGMYWQGHHLAALRFALKHPASAEAFEDLIGLQHEGALHLRRLTLDIRPT